VAEVRTETDSPGIRFFRTGGQIMYEVEIAYGGEVTILQSRISNLEVLVCELLAKNERLRTAVRSESGLGSETFGLIGHSLSASSRRQE
jgi:hypothetical protein